ncbi:MAG: trypsin-like peptidase domain-containing protein, partial [Candidatus Omnitrophica bacterium]|nr:trypsin-like peptidase domain-containing protein [Candidatus Omnitrophota bacterium]
PFEDFFRGLQEQQQGDNSEPEKSESDSAVPNFIPFGIGSGMIIRSDQSGAWILTNNHVLENAERVQIEFFDESPILDLDLVSDPNDSNRNEYLDRKSDLALIKLTPEVVGERKLEPIEFADSDQLKVGHLVYTLGAPLDREWTFSQGMISGVDRGQVIPKKSPDEIRYEGLIQTTAFINVGNSGGPLLDIEGRVVGINVAIQTSGMSSGFIGIGFAIPSNRAVHVIDAFVTQGKLVRGFLGVKIGPPNPDETEYFGLKPRTGVEVVSVYDDSPAAQGGMQAKDIVLSFNGQEVRNPGHLQELVAYAPVEKKAKVEVLRGGKKVELEVPIGVQPDTVSTVLQSAKKGDEIQELGAVLRNLDPESAEYFKDAGYNSGVLVDEIMPGSPLSKNNQSIKPGSLITAIEHQPVKTVEEVKEQIDKVIASRGSNAREVRVMVNYVPAGESKETFQVIRLDVQSQ